MNSWLDVNNAGEQKEYTIIPRGEIVCIQLIIRPGGYDTQKQFGIEGQVATQGPSGAIYLDCECAILGGEYNKRRVWHKIGLWTDKGPEWALQGRAFIRALLNSATGINPTDQSPTAKQARTIKRFEDLENRPFVARIGVEIDAQYGPKNKIDIIIQPGHPAYSSAWSKPAV